MNTLLIFIKNARLGHVKTRLAATTGDAEALRIYQVLLEKTRIAALHTNAHRWLWYSEEVQYNDEWNDALFFKSTQPTGDLGERMAHAFQAAFEKGSERVLIIGSDCPEITREQMEAAFDQLHTHDVVIGPTYDGGYYLLGMSAFHPTLFEGIDWSTESVLPQTLQKVTESGLRHVLLPALNDIDYETDWRAYLERKG